MGGSVLLRGLKNGIFVVVVFLDRLNLPINLRAKSLSWGKSSGSLGGLKEQ